MKNILQKATLALAITAVSTGAFAGVHTVDGEGDIILANEIFGAGSEDTLVAVPVSTYVVDPAKNSINNDNGATPPVLIATGEATVKYTLDKGAVFGEDLSDIQKWADSNAILTFELGVDADPLNNVTIVIGGSGTLPVVAGYAIVVDQGGAIGDNTVTFKVNVSTAGTADTLVNTVAGQFRVKNLTSALERGVASPAVRLGTEFRNVDTAVTDTQSAQVILRSQDGVELTGSVTDYATANGGRARIDVADTELSFTGDQVNNTGTGAAQDFDESDNVDFVTLGDLQIVRSEYDGGVTADLVVKKENGDDFDFQGSDQPALTLTSTSTYGAFSSVYLRPVDVNGGVCTDTAGGTDFVGTGLADGSERLFNLSGEDTNELESGYTVCAVANSTDVIPESIFSASLDVTYFNPRYTNSEDTLEYGQLLRNGCQVTLFNVPNPTSGDKAFIRLSNVSEKPGAVRAYMWDQDGTQLDLNSELVSSLAPHATVALNTNPGQSGYLGDSMPTYAAQTSGRNRLVIQGAFPACEALGLIRTPANVLTNMTSTTYSGDATRLGPQTNGTSNTSN